MIGDLALDSLRLAIKCVLAAAFMKVDKLSAGRNKWAAVGRDRGVRTGEVVGPSRIECESQDV